MFIAKKQKQKQTQTNNQKKQKQQVITNRLDRLNQGRIRGGGRHPARAPTKDFSHDIPQQFSRLPTLGEIFLSAPPPPTPPS